MAQMTFWLLATIAGTAAVSLVTAAILFEYMKSKDSRASIDYVWMTFRRTMIISSAMAGSIYGITQASDILEAIGKAIHGQ